MNDSEREWRFTNLRALGCVACVFRYNAGLPVPRSPPEIRHLNECGQAGRKRRGDEFTICLCGWHHRGDPSDGYTATEMLHYYGPSLARNSKLFRATYGSDNELLKLMNGHLSRRLRLASPEELESGVALPGPALPGPG